MLSSLSCRTPKCRVTGYRTYIGVVNSNGRFQLDVELLIEEHELKFDYTIQSLQIKISHYFDSITYELLFLICNEAEQVLFAGYLKNYT